MVVARLRPSADVAPDDALDVDARLMPELVDTARVLEVAGVAQTSGRGTTALPVATSVGTGAVAETAPTTTGAPAAARLGAGDVAAADPVTTGVPVAESAGGAVEAATAPLTMGVPEAASVGADVDTEAAPETTGVPVATSVGAGVVALTVPDVPEPELVPNSSSASQYVAADTSHLVEVGRRRCHRAVGRELDDEPRGTVARLAGDDEALLPLELGEQRVCVAQRRHESPHV